MVLLIPAALIAGIAVFLLSNEEDRLSRQARITAERGLLIKAEQLSGQIKDVQRELEQKLLSLDQSSLEKELTGLETRNPLVRNVFIWKEPRGLVLPDELLPLSNEQRSFIGRYQPIFSDGQWRILEPENENARQTYKKSKSSEKMHSGWIPWFWQNQLGYLGWMRHNDSGTYYGIELEMIRLLMDLTALPFDERLPEDYSIGLIDGNERLLCRWGGAYEQETVRVSVGETLPHWNLVLYTENGTLVEAGGIRVLAGMLVFILFAVLFCGGILLIKETRRARLDAELKTTFVSNVSHELKTPLTTIRMYADLLAEGRVASPEKEQQYLSTITGESERLTRLVNNVLDFSRLEQRRKKYRPESVDLCEMLKNICHTQRLRLNDAAMVLESELPPQPVVLETDRDAIEQVLLNMIDNAIKYAATGKLLSIQLKTSETRCRISIADAGSGIPEKHRRKIFERFYRIDSSVTATHQGCGLGLAISAHLLEDLGGSLRYETSQHGGACFIVELPLKESHS